MDSSVTMASVWTTAAWSVMVLSLVEMVLMNMPGVQSNATESSVATEQSAWHTPATVMASKTVLTEAMRSRTALNWYPKSWPQAQRTMPRVSLVAIS